jgi:hypothetical protein
MRLNRKWCKSKHAQTCLYYDQVAWLPLSRAMKSFQELHSHTMETWKISLIMVLLHNLGLEIELCRTCGLYIQNKETKLKLRFINYEEVVFETFRSLGKFTSITFPVRAGNFSPHHCIQTGSGSHPASYPMGISGSFPGGKAAGVVMFTTHLHLVPNSRMREAIPPLPHYAFMA